MQAQIRCKILEKDTHDPIIGATVMTVGTKKIIAVTDQNGCFVLSEGFNKPVRISYLGYKSIQVTPKKSGIYYLSSSINSLQEVVVTAQEGHGLSSVSTISKQAMEHLQFCRFAGAAARR